MQPVCQTLLKLVDATSIDGLWQEWLRSMIEDYGFDRLFYGSTQFATSSALGNVGDRLVLTNYCQDYIREFFDSELYMYGPMFKWALENTGACSWGHISEMLRGSEIPPKTQEVLDLNRKFGVVSGYTISFQPENERTRSVISLAMNQNKSQAAADSVWNAYGDEILLINKVAHTKSLTLPHNTISGKRLTNRQREVLFWVSDGKTIQDIAKILDVSTPTVEKHLRLARETLNVETTAQAILRLALQNQIFVFNGETSRQTVKR